MTKVKRNIGLEILEGLREIKRGEYGRVTTVPSVSRIREKEVFPRRSSLSCWVSRCALFKSGSRDVARHRARHGHFC
jgi:hypothetical protein